MPRRLLAVLVPLLLAVATASAMALKSGLDQARLAASGRRRDVEASALERGWVATFGCVRHDLAIGVAPSGRAYRLGESRPESETDRVFTPLAGAGDCDEEKRPLQIFALVEDDDALATTISHVYQARVAPPPVAALVTGVIGYGAGHERDADRARVLLGQIGLSVAKVPLLVKGKRPGVLWVAVVTATAGGHGFLLCGLAVRWALRRERRRRARLAGTESDEEESFFKSETLD